jgi:hypothetical protein
MAELTSDADTADKQIPPGKAKLTKLGWLWAAGVAIAFVLMWLLSGYDDVTELTPDHSDILGYCFDAAGLVALVSALVGFFQSKGAMRARVALALCFAIEGGLATILLSDRVTSIIENRIDFPAGKTKTFHALLPIGRAYRMDSRTGSSWIIQPIIWTNIEITQSDYRLMLAHHGWNGQGSEPESVSSDGYFCANVVMQQSGEALRVLHAGTSKLPAGTIGICSEMASKNPSLTIVS